MEKIGSILVYMPHWLGDTVMALPTLRRLRKIFPDVRLVVLALEEFAPIYDALGVDECIFVTRRDLIHPFYMARLVMRLRKAKIDIGVLLANSFRSAFLFYAMGITYIAGYQKEGRSLFLTHRFPLLDTYRKKHQSLAFSALIEQMFNLPKEEKSTEPLPILEKHLASARFLLREYIQEEETVPLIVFGIGAAYGPAKTWSTERYAFLAKNLVEKYHARILLLGSAKDQQEAAFMMRNHPGVVIDLTGKTSLAQTMGILKNCQIFVGNDSGLGHLAASIGVPVVSIFGSTSPDFTRPLGEDVEVLYAGVSCSPCFERKCPLKKQTMACMKAIRVDDVMEKVQKYLEPSP